MSSALKFIGVASTTQPSAGQYVKITSITSGTTYYVPITATGTATEVAAQVGDVVIIGNNEYVCTTGGLAAAQAWTELGDESSFALKTTTISAGTGLTGGGTLAADRTISLADNYGDTKNPYASKTKNFVLAAPATANGVPSFRKLLTSDLIASSGGGTMGLGSLMYGNADGSELVALNIGAAGKVLKSNGNTPVWADETNQTITLSGDATGSGTTAITVTLADTGVTAGTYSAVAVNTKGLVTAGGQVLEVINNGATPTVVTGGWYFEKDAAS